MSVTYTVYGYYSKADYAHNGEFVDEFDNRADAENCVKDFESVYGRIAWIETDGTAWSIDNPSQNKIQE